MVYYQNINIFIALKNKIRHSKYSSFFLICLIGIIGLLGVDKSTLITILKFLIQRTCDLNAFSLIPGVLVEPWKLLEPLKDSWSPERNKRDVQASIALFGDKGAPDTNHEKITYDIWKTILKI